MVSEKSKKITIEADDNDFEKEEKSKKNRIRVLSFSLGSEHYCVNTSQAKEVIKPPEITKVPTAPGFVLGIINLRGEIISVVDIRHFFGLPIKERSKDVRVIVSDVTGSPIGIIVDEVKGTIEIDAESIQPPLATLQGKLLEYTKGQVRLKSDDILIYLDIERVLKCEEMERIRKEGR